MPRAPWIRPLVVGWLAASVVGCSSPATEWRACVEEAVTTVGNYKQIITVATEKVRALPPASDAAGLADRKVLDDALTTAAADLAALTATVQQTRARVDAQLAGSSPDAAAVVHESCAQLKAAIQRASEAAKRAGPAIELYGKIAPK